MVTRGIWAKALVCILASLMLAGVAHASTIRFTVGANTTTVGGCTTYTDGEILVPATVCRDLLEGGLTWDGDLAAVVFHAAPARVTFVAGKFRVLIGGTETFLTHPAQLRGGRMYLPIGFLSECVGTKVTRTASSSVKLDLRAFPAITSPDERHPLEVKVAGIVHKAKVYRALPTSDQLRVSAEEVADMFDGEVTWDPELLAATVVIDGRKMVFVQDNKHALLDGMPFSLSRRPVLSREKLLIPLDSVCEMLHRQYIQEGAWDVQVGNPVE
jgi:hypothetical protein